MAENVVEEGVEEVVEEMPEGEAEEPAEDEKALGRTRVFAWRDRQRGFLIVTARNLKAALATVEAEHPNWLNYARAHDPATMGAQAGNILYLRQRGR